MAPPIISTITRGVQGKVDVQSLKRVLKSYTVTNITQPATTTGYATVTIAGNAIGAQALINAHESNKTPTLTVITSDLEIDGNNAINHVDNVVTEEVYLYQNDVVLNHEYVGTDPNSDSGAAALAGLIVNRGGTQSNALLQWNESTDKWCAGVQGSTHEILYSGVQSISRTADIAHGGVNRILFNDSTNGYISESAKFIYTESSLGEGATTQCLAITEPATIASYVSSTCKNYITFDGGYLTLGADAKQSQIRLYTRDATGDNGVSASRMTVDYTYITMKSHVLLNSGFNLTLTSGNVGIQSGNLTLTSGNVGIQSGNLTLTSGDVVVTSGHVKTGTQAGGLQLCGGTDNVSEVGAYISIYGNQCTAGIQGQLQLATGNQATANMYLDLNNAAGSFLFRGGVQNQELGPPGQSLYTLTTVASISATGQLSVANGVMPRTNDVGSIGDDPTTGGKRFLNIYGKNIFAESFKFTNVNLTVTATGEIESNQQRDAKLLTIGVSVITTADEHAEVVKLPLHLAGNTCIVCNTSSWQIRLYPYENHYINGLQNWYVVIPSKASYTFYAPDSTGWIVVGAWSTQLGDLLYQT